MTKTCYVTENTTLFGKKNKKQKIYNVTSSEIFNCNDFLTIECLGWPLNKKVCKFQGSIQCLNSLSVYNIHPPFKTLNKVAEVVYETLNRVK